jgi:hypothetical protein
MAHIWLFLRLGERVYVREDLTRVLRRIRELAHNYDDLAEEYAIRIRARPNDEVPFRSYRKYSNAAAAMRKLRYLLRSDAIVIGKLEAIETALNLESTTEQFRALDDIGIDTSVLLPKLKSIQHPDTLSKLPPDPLVSLPSTSRINK